MKKLELYNAAIDFARELVGKAEHEFAFDSAVVSKGTELGVTPAQYPQFKGWVQNFLGTMRNHAAADAAAAAKLVTSGK